MKCHICNKEVRTNGSNHIYNCSKKREILLSANEIRLDFYKYNYPIISEQFFKETYIEKGYSLPDYEKEYGFPYSLVLFCLGIYGIKNRTLKESCFKTSKSKKFKETCLLRYGVENVSQSELIKRKKEDTFNKHYGKPNIWKCKEYYDWLHTHMYNKYGAKSVPNLHGNANPYNYKNYTEEQKESLALRAKEGFKKYWSSLSDEQKNIYIQKRCSKLVCTFNSKLESRVEKIIQDLGLDYKRSFWVARKSYDFRIYKTKIIIEVQGDFWHANPEIYKENDILNHGELKIAKDIWSKDLLKKELAEKYGYIVRYIWEKDINNINDSDLADRILSFIG